MAEASLCLPDIIPGLPNDLALMILVRIPRALHGSFRCVCSAWRDALQPLVVSALRNSLGISEVWLILLFKFCNISFCDPLLRRLSAPTPLLPLCSDLDPFVHVIGAIGSQVLFFPDGYSLDNITISCFDAASMQLQSDFVHPKVPMRVEFASATFDGHVYVAGGINSQKQYREVARVNVKMRTWEAMPDMHEIRVEATAVVMQGCLYVIGGRSNGEVVHSGERWDPSRQEWMLEPELWPAHLCPAGFYTSLERPKIAVVLDTLYALRYDSKWDEWGEWDKPDEWELMRYERVSKLWTSLGYLSTRQTSCTCGTKSLNNLVGVGKELWVVINCKEHRDAAILSCVPQIGTQPLSWRLVTNTSSFGFAHVHGHVHV